LNARLTPSISIRSVDFLKPAVSLSIIGYPAIFNPVSIISLVVPGIGETMAKLRLPLIILI
jgi:hypothetical protein